MGNCSTAEVKSSLSPSTTEPSSPVSRNSHSKSKINKRRQAGNHNGFSRSLKEGFPNGQSGSDNGISGGLNKVFPNGQSDIGNLKEVFPNGQSVSDNGLSGSQNKVFPNGQSDIGNLKEGFSNGQSGSDNGLSGSVFPNGQPDSGNLEEVFPKGHILPTSKLRVFSFAELKAATKDFKEDTILRIGVFGKVYKGWLDDKTFAPSEFGCGLPVAVKKLNFGWKAKQRRSAVRGKIRIVWQSDVNFLGRLSHPNLVKLIGYCWEEEKLFVVYEFMPNGNLEECLFTREIEPLSWRNRLKVAIGAARGLAFLHSLEKQIIYGDFKASNILIDLDYNAKLSDIGLGKISPADRNSDVTMQVIGSYGYAARDYSDEGHNQYEKSDVYCFGVVLLEMLCGAIDGSRPIEQHNLVEWAKPYLLDQRNLLTHGIDPRLDGPPTAALQTAELILKCLELAPVSRPSMEQVVETLKQIEAVGFEPSMRIVAGAWEALSRSLLLYRGEPVGTIANSDPSDDKYQVFVRDFVPSGLAFLMNGEPEIVKNFLLKTLQMQSWEKRFDRFEMGEGVMPASFGVVNDPDRDYETLIADFGETSIGKVTPVDSGFWWIILLHAYTRSTGDSSLAEMPDCQRGLHLILNLCLSKGFDAFPTLLCADGCCMIDRRMGLYGYPIEIQALFFMALKCALLLLKQDKEGKEFKQRIVKRLYALRYHMRSYFWLDFQQLNVIYQYKTEEYSYTAVNKFNIVPDSIPNWVFDFMPTRGGYFIGNVSPARMDFRWFCLGNCVAILSSLATPEQSEAIMDLIEERWEELIGEMPLKISYPAIEGVEWQIVTGCDPKNTSWSYHNGGTWPVLLWLLTAASIKTGRPQIAKRAIDLAERRLLKDNWPEFYDGKLGRYVGKQTRKFQTWSTAGYLVAKMMLEDPSNLGMISFEGDEEMKPLLERSATWT